MSTQENHQADFGFVAGPSQEEIEMMQQALSQVLGSFSGRTLTQFEAEVWSRVMKATTAEKFKRFLQAFLFSPQAKYGPPAPHDAFQWLGLRRDADALLADLERAVARIGPYRVPTEIKDPVLLHAIEAMGGWARVNETLPAQSETYLRKEFKDRFLAAVNDAERRVQIEREAPPPLREIGYDKRPLSLANADSNQNRIGIEAEKVANASQIEVLRP